MSIVAITRSLGLAGAWIAITLLAGCAGNRDGTGSGEVPLTNIDFPFSAEPVLAGGSTVNIVVKPIGVPVPDGLYDGGNARIESKSSSERNFVVWNSTRPFWIRFKSMNSNKGNGGNRFGPENYTQANSDGVGQYKYYYRQELPHGGGKTQSAKYLLTFAGVDPADPKKALGFELDPVIIVDR